MSDDLTSSTPSTSGSSNAKKPRKAGTKKKKTCTKVETDTSQIKPPGESVEQKATASLMEYLQTLSATKQKESEDKLDKQLEHTYLRGSNEMRQLKVYAEHVVSELFSDYIIVGHTHSGDTEVMVTAKSDRDKEGLTEAVRRYINSDGFPIV